MTLWIASEIGAAVSTALATGLALAVRSMTTTPLPPKPKPIDPAVVAAIAAAVSSLHSGCRVTRIEEES